MKKIIHSILGISSKSKKVDLDNSSNVMSKLDEIQKDNDKRTLSTIKDRDKFQSALDTMPIIYIRVDIDMNIIFANKKFKEVFGYSSRLDSIISIDDTNNIKKKIKKISNLPLDVLVNMVAIDKTVRNIKFNITMDTIYNEFLFYGDDITDVVSKTKRVETYLNTKENILNHYIGGMISIDNNGVITYINRVGEIQLGYKLLDIINKKHIYDIIYTAESNNIFIDNNRFNNVSQLSMRNSSGSIYNVYVIISPMYNMHNLQCGYLIVWHCEEFLHQLRSFI